jgi:hypothetical protein
MSFPKQVTVPDTSADMSVPALQLDPVSGSIFEYTSFIVADGTTVWMLISPIPNDVVEPPVLPPTALEVVNGGTPLFAQVPVSLQVTPSSPVPPDPATIFFATKSGDGAGDVRIMTGVL